MWYISVTPTTTKGSNMSNLINKRNAGKPFTFKATNFLVKKAGKMPAHSIANVLGRTEKAVRRKAEKLGLSLAVIG